jgi:hypothetical protein
LKLKNPDPLTATTILPGKKIKAVEKLLVRDSDTVGGVLNSILFLTVYPSILTVAQIKKKYQKKNSNFKILHSCFKPFTFYFKHFQLEPVQIKRFN